MQAMILAAGFGARLLPYSRLLPKPLFPLLNEPLLLLTIKHLQNAGFDHIIVNCHYLKEQIIEALAGMVGVVIQEENIVLGTGGGLRMALTLMRDEPVLVTNGDIYHSIDYRELYRAHTEADCAVSMAMHDCSRFNKVLVEEGFVTNFDMQSAFKNMAFTGLHVLNPEILKTIPEEEQFCIIDCYRALLKNGNTIKAVDVSGCSWTDMGTVEDYLALHGQLLKGDIDRWPEFTETSGKSYVCSRENEQLLHHSFKEWACVGRADLPSNVTIMRCVVWDGAVLRKGEIYSDALLVPEEIVQPALTTGM